MDTAWLSGACMACGYGFLAVAAAVFIRAFAGSDSLIRDAVAQTAGGNPLPSRYLLFFLNICLAGLVLWSVLVGKKPLSMASNLLNGLSPDLLTATSGTAYLLSKVGDGDLLSLFRKSST